MTVNESKEMPMSTSYKSRERALLEQLAHATMSDPKAPPDDVRAARARLEGSAGFDYARLSGDEYDLLEHMIGKAAGHEPSAVEFAGVEKAARAVADDAKARVEAEEARLAAIAAEARAET